MLLLFDDIWILWSESTVLKYMETIGIVKIPGRFSSKVYLYGR